MKKKILLIVIVTILVILIIMSAIIYYNSEYITIGVKGHLSGPDVVGWEPPDKGYIITNSREVIRYENENKTFIGKMREEDFVKLIKNVYDKVQNKDISESIEEGPMELDFVKIKGKFYYIYHSFRVELEDFIREKTVKE